MEQELLKRSFIFLLQGNQSYLTLVFIYSVVIFSDDGVIQVIQSPILLGVHSLVLYPFKVFSGGKIMG